MKKFFVGVLTAVMLFGFGSMTAECCHGNYYCYQDCDDTYRNDARNDDNYNGEYCGRYGCGRNNS